MEKQCKICYKSFSNGKAYGGHVRSHLLNLRIPPKQDPPPSPSPSYSSREGDDGEFFYELRENPKKSFRIADPVFSFGGGSNSNATATSSFVVQDRESETESSKNVKNVPTHRRRSKLNRPKSDHFRYKVARPSQTMDPEPVSSISEDNITTTEEDVARCLMKLSRGKWSYKSEEAEKSEEDGVDSDDFMEHKNKNHSKGKYSCDKCQKSFKCYQALGGHRASHMKIKVCSNNINNFSSPSKPEEKALVPRTHECPVCLRVFTSGQALGGHKRSHLLNQNRNPVPTKISSSGSSLFDLNMPAPMEEDPEFEFEFSAVSDAEFVTPF